MFVGLNFFACDIVTMLNMFFEYCRGCFLSSDNIIHIMIITIILCYVTAQCRYVICYVVCSLFTQRGSKEGKEEEVEITEEEEEEEEKDKEEEGDEDEEEIPSRKEVCGCMKPA